MQVLIIGLKILLTPIYLPIKVLGVIMLLMFRDAYDICWGDDDD